jgi:hypothetical protein
MIVHRRRLLIVNRALTGRQARPSTAAARPARKQGKQAGSGRPLGDLVELWAKPIARGIDRLTARLPGRWATRLGGCSACSRRRHFLNALVPDSGSLAAWQGVLWALRPAFKRYYGRRKVPSRPAPRSLQSS